MSANPQPGDGDTDQTGDDGAGRSPALIATAVALPVMLLVGVIVFAIMATRSPVLEPVALGAAEAPDAESEECTALLEALPDKLPESSDTDLVRAELVEPAPAGAAAWQSPDEPNAEPVVLRCGLERPHEFTQDSQIQAVDAVDWLQIDGADQGLESSTWTAVDRGVYIALTVPSGTGSGPIQSMSKIVAETLPATELDPAPARDLENPELPGIPVAPGN